MKYLLLILLTLNLYGQNILGKVDVFDMPEFGLSNIKAKIDTGAKTSSIHCSEITLLENNFVKFSPQDSNDDSNHIYIVKPISRISEVKSSNGKSQERYFIKTTIIIYEKIYNIEVSLSCRTSMKYPLLIGRELLKQGFLVDVSKQDLSFKSKN
ncbi:MAG: hypothetical protein ACJAWW_002196 [Sulfurimonas sp.]|jgi:hypothetical protein